MRIEVENLTSEGQTYERMYGADELQLDESRAQLTGETEVEGRASKRGDEIRIEGRIIAHAEVACDRCLKTVKAPLEVEFSESFMPRAFEGEAEDETELQKDDLNFSFYEGDAVELDELVREQLLLALPTRFVCREECKGLCPTCGADLNEETCGCAKSEVDPRWAALEKFKNRES